MRPSKYIACEAVHFPACFLSNERKLKQTPSYESMTRHEQLNRAYCTVNATDTRTSDNDWAERVTAPIGVNMC